MALLDFLFGRTKPVPTTSTKSQVSKLPEEVAPFVSEVLEESQRLYGEGRAAGYQPFPGEVIAPRTPEEEAAISGLRSLIGTQDPYRAESEARLRDIPLEFTSEQADKFINPYQQGVIDVAKRRATEDFQNTIMPAFERKVIQEGGGPGGLGTRAGVASAELGKNLQTQLSDIQTIGQQKAFQDAYKRFTDQGTRERTLAGDIGAQGLNKFNIGLTEQGLGQTLGQADREEAQAILNKEFGDYVEEEQFPESELAQYSSFVYGNPFLRGAVDTTATTQGTLQPSASIGQQLLGAGLTGLNIYGQATGKNPFAAAGNEISSWFGNKGGYIRDGLAGLPTVRRQSSGRVFNSPTGINLLNPSLKDILSRSGSTGRTSIADQRKRQQKNLEEIRQNLLGSAKTRGDLTQSQQKQRDAAILEAMQSQRKQLENRDTTSGPIDSAMEALYSKGTENLGLIGALNKVVPKITAGMAKENREIKEIEARIAAKEADLSRASSATLSAEERAALDRQLAGEQQAVIAKQKIETDMEAERERRDKENLTEVEKKVNILNSMNDSDARLQAARNAAKDNMAKTTAADIKLIDKKVYDSYSAVIIRDAEGNITGLKNSAGNPLEQKQLAPMLHLINSATAIFVDELNTNNNKGKAWKKVTEHIRLTNPITPTNPPPADENPPIILDPSPISR